MLVSQIRMLAASSSYEVRCPRSLQVRDLGTCLGLLRPCFYVIRHV